MASGNENFNRNLAKALEKMRKGAVTGLRLGAALIKRNSQKRAPVDTGNLRAGHYVSVQVNKDNAVAEIGVTAEYAAYVHEITNPSEGVPRTGFGAKGDYWEKGEPKFLEKAIDEEIPNVKKLIQKHASVV